VPLVSDLREKERATARGAPDWRRRMSDTIAHALLVYAALQIVVTMAALPARVHPGWRFAGLVVLVGAIVPACRWREARWNRLVGAAESHPALDASFRRERTAIWLTAIALPFVMGATFRGLAALLAA
jgi:hypothetical protein